MKFFFCGLYPQLRYATDRRPEREQRDKQKGNVAGYVQDIEWVGPVNHTPGSYTHEREWHALARLWSAGLHTRGAYAASDLPELLSTAVEPYLPQAR